MVNMSPNAVLLIQTVVALLRFYEKVPSLKVGKRDQEVGHRLAVLMVSVQTHCSVPGQEDGRVALGAAHGVDHSVQEAIGDGESPGLCPEPHQRALRVGAEENALLIRRGGDAGRGVAGVRHGQETVQKQAPSNRLDWNKPAMGRSWHNDLVKRPQVRSSHFRQKAGRNRRSFLCALMAIRCQAFPHQAAVGVAKFGCWCGVSARSSPLADQSQACRTTIGELAESFQEPGGKGEEGLGGLGQVFLSIHMLSSFCS